MERKVLMVDDDQGIINNTFKELKKIEFGVPVLFESKTNAEEAVVFLRGNHANYNVILMDVEFKRQKMQGFDAVKGIRSFSKIPILMCSASKEASLVGVGFGANGFISKGLMNNEELEKCRQELRKFLDIHVVKKEVFRGIKRH